MKNWIKNLVNDDVAIVLGIVNLLLVLVAACVAKGFVGDDVSSFAGCAFLVGFVAVVFEWIFCQKSDKAPAGAIIGVLLATVFAYVLGV